VRSQNQIAKAATLGNVESFYGCRFGVSREDGRRRFARTLTEAAVWADADRRVLGWPTWTRPANR
jgi:hypothetical protein